MKVKVDASGRLYLPSELRDRTPHDHYNAELREDGSILLKPLIEDPIEKYYGSVKAEHLEPKEMKVKAREALRKKLLHDDIH
jgi:bifunctional DNA-binding transcriptional regulator/antitoxin component of YhaV-PrlF toxin-antitoxin module